MHAFFCGGPVWLKNPLGLPEWSLGTNFASAFRLIPFCLGKCENQPTSMHTASLDRSDGKHENIFTPDTQQAPRTNTLIMKNTLIRTLLALLCTAFTAIAADKAPPKLDAMVDNAMKAYNASDSKAFFADFAAAMASIATPDTYKLMYEDMAKPKYGKFVSKTLIPAETSINEDAPLLVYKAKFEKGEAKLGVNFLKEGAGFKIMQISIQ
jgi:hypothetical protein